MRRRGLTLSETVLAIFLLVSGFVVMFRLMHAALQYQATIDSQQTAVMLAERQLEEIRAWSWEKHGPGGGGEFSDWTQCPGLGGPGPAEGYPDFQVTVDAVAQQLYSPCSLFEEAYPTATDRRALDDAARRVTVTVAWRDRSFTLRSLVAAPTGEPAATDPVVVSPGNPASLAPGAASSLLTAAAYDSDGRELPNLTFVWYTSGVGDGTINATRDGRRARLVNQIFDSTPPPTGPNPTGVGVGPCQVVARGRYRGKEVRGVSGVQNLNGP